MDYVIRDLAFIPAAVRGSLTFSTFFDHLQRRASRIELQAHQRPIGRVLDLIDLFVSQSIAVSLDSLVPFVGLDEYGCDHAAIRLVFAEGL